MKPSRFTSLRTSCFVCGLTLPTMTNGRRRTLTPFSTSSRENCKSSVNSASSPASRSRFAWSARMVLPSKDCPSARSCRPAIVGALSTTPTRMAKPFFTSRLVLSDSFAFPTCQETPKGTRLPTSLQTLPSRKRHCPSPSLSLSLPNRLSYSRGRRSSPHFAAHFPSSSALSFRVVPSSSVSSAPGATAAITS